MLDQFEGMPMGRFGEDSDCGYKECISFNIVAIDHVSIYRLEIGVYH